MDAIERIAPTTGSHPVPIEKQDRYRHEKDKWAVAGFTPVASALVSPHRIAECGIQMEARVSSMSVWGEDGVAVFARVLRVHAREDLVIPGTSYVDLQRWRPLYYTFRHYFGQGASWAAPSRRSGDCGPSHEPSSAFRVPPEKPRGLPDDLGNGPGLDAWRM